MSLGLTRALLWIICGITMTAFAADERPTIEVPVEATVLADYQLFVAGRDIQKIKHYSGNGARRDVIEMVLVQQALALGGFPLQFHFIATDARARSPKLLQRGDLLVTVDSIWHSSIGPYAKDIFLTTPLIKRGEYMAGIATSPHNNAVLQLRSKEQLSTLTAVSSRVFTADWQTLSALHLAGLKEEDDWLTMARLVSKQWIDFMLVPLDSAGTLSMPADGVEMVLVPGIKVLLDDSRHFAVSRRHPLAKQAFLALQQGLTALEKTGRIRQAYIDCGFFNQAATHWTLLNQTATKPSHNKLQ